MKNNKDKAVHWFIIGTFVTLYLLTSIISTIHVIDFFELSNSKWLAITLAIAFEVGAAASLASIVTLEKMNKTLVFALFITLTLFQAMGNSYYAFVNLHDFQGWVDLFGLQEEELIFQKRVLSIISGGILPLVALGFVKSLVDYIKPSEQYSKEDIQKIIEANENAPEPNDKLKKAAKEYFEDGNVPREKEDDTDEEWDEDHALDMVMNRMVEDLSEEDLEDLLVSEDSENERSVSEMTKELVEQDKYTKDVLDEESKEDIKTFNEVLKSKKSIDEDLQIKQIPTNKKIVR